MATYQKVATTSEIPPGGRKALVLGDRAVLLFHLDGRFVAVEDLCSHDGQPLTDGPLEGTAIECPRHGAKFDLCTGKALCMPAVEPIATFEVRVEGSDVLVRTEDGTLRPVPRACEPPHEEFKGDRPWPMKR
jgi:3-phenylpropionate/trans-cinnamate dioxygenase ferredoxin subunit